LETRTRTQHSGLSRSRARAQYLGHMRARTLRTHIGTRAQKRQKAHRRFAVNSHLSGRPAGDSGLRRPATQDRWLPGLLTPVNFFFFPTQGLTVSPDWLGPPGPLALVPTQNRGADPPLPPQPGAYCILRSLGSRSSASPAAVLPRPDLRLSSSALRLPKAPPPQASPPEASVRCPPGSSLPSRCAG
jgi:hypothetical protein